MVKRATKAKKAESKASATGRGRGRPSDYGPQFAKQAYKLCLLGATDEELADFFGVNPDTIHEWKKVHPEFSESIKDGKERADAEIADSLYQRAKGYTHPELYIAQYQGQIIKEEITKHYPPDTQAASLWLRNRQPARWRDKVDIEHAGKGGGPIQNQHDVALTPSDAYLRMIGK